jgi:hypothetical protein
MKIAVLLQAASTFVMGGTEFQADLIMNELVRAGHEVTCVSDMMGEPGPGLEGVEYIYLKSRGRKLAVLNFIPLMKSLKRIDPDIIYQRFRVPYTGMAAWYAKRNASKIPGKTRSHGTGCFFSITSSNIWDGTGSGMWIRSLPRHMISAKTSKNISGGIVW